MRLFRTTALAIFTFALLGATSAQAVSFYAEILTSDDFFLLPDTSAHATLTVDFAPFDLDWDSGTSGPNSGLGSGLVAPGAPLSYTHLFDPTPDSATVLAAWLFVLVADDQLFPDGPEVASIALDGSFWKTGQASLNLLLGDISALGLATFDGDSFAVEVSSAGGDFKVLASALKVKFEPVPEPGTLLLVGLGAALLGARRRAA